MKLSLNKTILLITVVLALFSQTVLAVPLAFPGAEGHGAYSVGGRGGDVYTVTNTTDSGAGSLREGIESATGPRTIVFAVSGLISLNDRLYVLNDNITIAGQTAPGDGICVSGHQFTFKASNLIVRFIRSRLGDETGQEDDSFSIQDGSHNVIMDHCSASWSVDEVFSCSTENQGAIDNVTVQWSIISEGLANSVHSKGSHSYGALIRGCYGAKYTYHHNLFAHCNSRMPRPGNYDVNDYISDPLGLEFDFRNNVIYNWGGICPGYDADSDSATRMNFVGNYAFAGPNGTNGYLYDPGCKHFQGYFEGNYLGGSIPGDQYTLCNWTGFSAGEKAAWIQPVPFSTGPIVTDIAPYAYDKVLGHAGASFARDSVDARIVNEVLTGTGSVIDDEDEVGGWPAYNSTAAPTDTDLDGMPDAWETANGLNPSVADNNGYDLDVDYTNLEVYLNSLVAHLWGEWDTPPEAATIVSPADAATDVALTADLVWNAGARAFSHDVYFGTDPTPDAGEFMGNQTATTYDPGILSSYTTYYWAIDEVNSWGTTIGPVWSFTTGELEFDPPTPDPATFAIAPTADSGSAISMTATAGSDASGPVEYLFTETSGNSGGDSSNWQTGTSYTDTGLTESTQYTYTVTMRDGLGNTGAASSPANATTDSCTASDKVQFIYTQTDASTGSGTLSGCVDFTSIGGPGSLYVTGVMPAPTINQKGSAMSVPAGMVGYINAQGDAEQGISNNGVHLGWSGDATLSGSYGGSTYSVTVPLLVPDTAPWDYEYEYKLTDDYPSNDVSGGAVRFAGWIGADGYGHRHTAATVALTTGADTLTINNFLATLGQYAYDDVTVPDTLGITAGCREGATFNDAMYVDEVTFSGTLDIGDLSSTSDEFDPPTPDPATFAVAPAAISDTAISMTSTTGTDVSGPVQYYFDAFDCFNAIHLHGYNA